MPCGRKTTLGGYEGLKLVRSTRNTSGFHFTDGGKKKYMGAKTPAAGVTPLDHTTLGAKFPHP